MPIKQAPRRAGELWPRKWRKSLPGFILGHMAGRRPVLAAMKNVNVGP
jgi:hypothetical protein